MVQMNGNDDLAEETNHKKKLLIKNLKEGKNLKKIMKKDVFNCPPSPPHIRWVWVDGWWNETWSVWLDNKNMNEPKVLYYCIIEIWLLKFQACKLCFLARHDDDDDEYLWNYSNSNLLVIKTKCWLSTCGGNCVGKDMIVSKDGYMAKLLYAAAQCNFFVGFEK